MISNKYPNRESQGIRNTRHLNTKISPWKEIIKKRINEINTWFFEKINKNDKP
jgi:hypothetical protein